MNLSFQVQNLLKLLKSSKTKLEINNDADSEKYNAISDVIYISSNNKITQKGLEDANPFCLKLISMYKVYFNSKQSKLLHLLNIILTNVSLVMFIMTLLFRITLGKSRGVCLLTLTIVLLATILKLFMDGNALKRACKFIKKNINKINDEDVNKENINRVELLIKQNKLKLLINATKTKIIMLCALLVLMI